MYLLKSVPQITKYSQVGTSQKFPKIQMMNYVKLNTYKLGLFNLEFYKLPRQCRKFNESINFKTIQKHKKSLDDYLTQYCTSVHVIHQKIMKNNLQSAYNQVRMASN